MTQHVVAARFSSEFPGSQERSLHGASELMHDNRHSLADTEIIRRVREGDHEVFGMLYETYVERLWAFAYRYVRADDVARDIVQDVFLRIWAIRQQWDVATSIPAYLFAATRNQALKVIAHQTVTTRIHSANDSVDFLSGTEIRSPLHDLESSELARALSAVIATLPERQRFALSLRLDQEMTQAEIATVLGLSQPAVAKLLQRAALTIKAALDI